MSASRRRAPPTLARAWMLLFGCWSSRRFLLPILIRLRNDEGDPLGRPRKSRYTARELAIAPPDEGFREAEPDDAPARVPHPAAPRARCAGGEGGCGIRERVRHRLAPGGHRSIDDTSPMPVWQGIRSTIDAAATARRTEMRFAY